MHGPELFKDRKDAGRKLAKKLKKLELRDPIVLAVPSGGVPVGFEIAKGLGSKMDIIITKKIQLPDTTESGFGAVGINGEVSTFINKEFMSQLALSKKVIEQQKNKATSEIRKRESLFRGDKSFPNLKNKDVIATDDGLASGYSMLTAVNIIKKYHPNSITVAVPTSSESAKRLLKKRVDRFISIYTHPKSQPFAVASAYEKWHDLNDDEVLVLLKKSEDIEK